MRIDPERSAHAERTLHVRLNDTEQDLALHVRRGVLEAAPGIPDNADLAVELSKPVVLGMVYRDLYGTLAQAVEAGQAKITRGSLNDLREFLGWFDALDPTPLRLSDR